MSKRKIDKYRTNPQFQKLFELGDQVLSRIGIDPKSDALSPVMVAYYQQVGFLPAGVLNALVRLGWSLDDQAEFFSLDEMQQKFTLERVIKSAAGLDPDKLLSFQAHWMSQLPAGEKLDGCLPFLKKAGLIDDEADPSTRDRVASVIELAGDRLRVFGDIFQLDEFFVVDEDLKIDDKNFQKRVVKPENAIDLLRDLQKRFSNLTDFVAGPIHDLLQGFSAEKQVKVGDVFPALRLCVTGKAQGADLFKSLELLGRESVVRRMDRAIGLAESQRV
jgi:glutamyl-tRNA synthetase